ncbi:MAG: hypothetical protein WC073_00265 [Sterolibacterium sp.]
MNLRLLESLFLLLLAGCASGGPRWHADAVGWLETYREQALAGETRLAPAAYANALAEFKRGGDWDGLAVAHLTRCAVERATDQPLLGCAAYTAQQPLGASRSNDAYARWLAGAATREDIEFLPPVYRDLAAAMQSGNAALSAERLSRIEPPLSALVALALVWRELPDAGPALAAGEALAGKQGWLAAHRTCLGREIVLLKQRGDAAGAAEREKRLRLLGTGP